MYVVQGRNVQTILVAGAIMITEFAKKRESRFGDVLLMDGPVTTNYMSPNERVVFWEERDANPFFHFMEGLWMIAGREDVAWLSQFSSNIGQFSDDGVTFHGAYGFRWLNHFSKEVEGGYTNFDQLETVVEMLKSNPNERRCVVGMWDPEVDLGRQGKDIPCNTQIMFSINFDGALDMTVCNRSNDMVWGAYGANAVHFSMLQEVMAARIGVSIGRYWQISNNFHAYTKTFGQVEPLIQFIDQPSDTIDPYASGEVDPFPMVNTEWDDWNSELLMFMEEGPVMGYKDVFFRKVANPMYSAWFAYKDKDDPDRFEKAFNFANSIAASDWRKACVEWLQRRQQK